MAASLEDRFHAAADYLAHLVTADPKRVRDADKLRLYGLFKQATAGDCASKRPGMLEFAARSKWCALSAR
jgi:acyl-CoA-binding protein